MSFSDKARHCAKVEWAPRESFFMKSGACSGSLSSNRIKDPESKFVMSGAGMSPLSEWDPTWAATCVKMNTTRRPRVFCLASLSSWSALA